MHASGHLPYIGARGSECTLIITEGDSAKALAVAGLEVVGRERYGVFPLRGKPLNVREASAKKVGDNEELTGLMRALGLQPGKHYLHQAASLRDASSHSQQATVLRDARDGDGDGAGAGAGAGAGGELPMSSHSQRGAGGELRYGRLMLMADQVCDLPPSPTLPMCMHLTRPVLMADQDTDGSHIKGLVISMIHHFWPELLRADYLQEFQTPLLKARRLTDGAVAAFFSIGEYEAWRSPTHLPPSTECMHPAAPIYRRVRGVEGEAAPDGARPLEIEVLQGAGHVDGAGGARVLRAARRAPCPAAVRRPSGR